MIYFEGAPRFRVSGSTYFQPTTDKGQARSTIPPNNRVLGILVIATIVTIVQVLGKHMISKYLDP